ncbi:anhydro-N-acetylmuramic acid kinase [Legionella feeleii]|uniref:Anhydro-N-acetylmuramic acid kinase n=1 Tax=Legionella feeleii TaxID=453 RepID=A0A0W0U4Z6_9GAMM|nr:anhydro-N-acetylmuramic acid kinase [Legionella feeleii]KTD02699.1 anhydro-N-acetylmuramic acid kinase [Legionella feeleii]SPX59742.1 anhydro-N-acetylmuramic acid kinase [Legionella feeleii]
MKLFIGLMSGTSMDGIDAALIDLSSHSFIAGITCPYNPEIKQRLLEVSNGDRYGLKQFSQLNTLLGREFAKAALELMTKAKVSAKNIQAIGSHGQTLCHDATADIPYTVQLGCAHTIAELTGVPVVADFRTRDLVVGGQGAPFAPLYHQALFQGQGYPLAIINIGGIANMTYLADEYDLHGYDLGPGNCLMDAWVKKHLGHDYDKSGEWAAQGRVIEPLLDALLTDAYFKRQQPKSIGKEYFSLDWLATYLQPTYDAVDVQATLLGLTARAIVHELKAGNLSPKRLLLCGGGAHNTALLNTLTDLLPEISVDSTAALNINPDFIEAAMFAWLAEKTLNHTPVNLCQVTGSTRLIILGAIYPPGIDKGNSLRV